MSTLFILYKKELGHYFKSPFGWIVIVFILLMQGVCLSESLKTYQESPTSVNLFALEFNSPLFLFFFVFLFPLITMKLFAEEERIGTREPLMTAPVRTWQVLLGKYFASYTYYALLWLPLLLHVELFQIIADSPAPITRNEVFSTFVFLWIVGAFFCAVGCLASALTSSQIIAGIISTAAITFYVYLGILLMKWGNAFAAASIFEFLNFEQHLQRFTIGIIDTRIIALYLSLAVFTLTVTHHVIDFRRWKN